MTKMIALGESLRLIMMATTIQKLQLIDWLLSIKCEIGTDFLVLLYSCSGTDAHHL